MPYGEFRRGVADGRLGNVERFGMPAAIDQGPRQHDPEGEIVGVRVERSAEPVDAEVRTAAAALYETHQVQEVCRRPPRQTVHGKRSRTFQIAALKSGDGLLQ
jgi:hypothetical protein